MLNKKIGLGVLSAGLLLAGCGGGGDDDSAVATVPLTLANYDDITLSVAAGIVGSDSIFSTFESVASLDSTLSGASGLNVLNSGRVGDIAQFALNRFAVRQPNLEQPAAVTNGTELCAFGGRLLISVDDVDNDGEESVGDSVSVVADQCVLEPGVPAVNGSLGIRLVAVSYGRDGYLTSGAADLSFENFSSAGLVLNGGARISLDSTKVVLAYRNLSSTYGGQTLTYNYTLTSNVDVSPSSATVAGQFAIDGSTYTLSTPVTIQFGALYPATGTLRIGDGRGNRVEAVMSAGGFDANLYLAGDDVRDSTTAYLWSAL